MTLQGSLWASAALAINNRLVINSKPGRDIRRMVVLLGWIPPQSARLSEAYHYPYSGCSGFLAEE